MWVADDYFSPDPGWQLCPIVITCNRPVFPDRAMAVRQLASAAWERSIPRKSVLNAA